MTASLGTFNSSNINQYPSGMGTVEAPKPVGLATGDIWLILHARRGTAAETEIPPGFALQTEVLGSNLRCRTFAKIATETDTKRTSVEWDQVTGLAAMIQSVRLTGQGLNHPQGGHGESDAVAGTSHSTTVGTVGGSGPGPLLLWVANGLTATTYSPPTTQGGAWAEHSDTQMGTTNAERIALAVYLSTTDVAASLSGDTTFASSASVTACMLRYRLQNASALDPQLLEDKKIELKQAAEDEFYDLWRGLPSGITPVIERSNSQFKAADGDPIGDLDRYRMDTTYDIRTRLINKLYSANNAFDAGNAVSLAALTWEY